MLGLSGEIHISVKHNMKGKHVFNIFLKEKIGKKHVKLESQSFPNLFGVKNIYSSHI